MPSAKVRRCNPASHSERERRGRRIANIQCPPHVISLATQTLEHSAILSSHLRSLSYLWHDVWRHGGAVVCGLGCVSNRYHFGGLFFPIAIHLGTRNIEAHSSIATAPSLTTPLVVRCTTSGRGYSCGTRACKPQPRRTTNNGFWKMEI